jgi:uncharacterized protein YwgA
MLTARQRLLASISESLGGVDLATFEGRLLLQKRIFMLTMSGVDLGYSYSWYLRGPYCPALTSDAFALAECSAEQRASLASELPETVRQAIASTREATGTAWTNPLKLELLSSIIFIARSTNDQDEEHLWERLHKLKPGRFTRELFDKAINHLKRKGYLSA